MTYLELCQFVQRYLAAGNDLPENPMTTTVGQTGLNYEITQWVQDAYKAICAEQENWLFRTNRGVIQLTNGTQSIDKATLAAATTPDYDRQLYFVFPNDSRYLLVALNQGTPPRPNTYVRGTEAFCYYIPYQRWRGWRDRGVIPSGMPQYFTVRPDQSLEFYPISDTSSTLSNYCIIMDYYSRFVVLTTDVDSPIFPEEYHEAIAWYAIYYWGLVRQSGPRFQTAKEEYDRIMNDMRHTQLPEPLLSLTEYFG